MLVHFIIIDRVALAKQEDYSLGSVGPSVSDSVCLCVCVSGCLSDLPCLYQIGNKTETIRNTAVMNGI